MAEIPQQFEELYGQKGGKNQLHLETGRVYNERWECVTPAFKLQGNTVSIHKGLPKCKAKVTAAEYSHTCVPLTALEKTFAQFRGECRLETASDNDPVQVKGKVLAILQRYPSLNFLGHRAILDAVRTCTRRCATTGEVRPGGGKVPHRPPPPDPDFQLPHFDNSAGHAPVLRPTRAARRLPRAHPYRQPDEDSESSGSYVTDNRPDSLLTTSEASLSGREFVMENQRPVMTRYVRARPSEVLESAAAVVPFRREQVAGLLALYPPAAVRPGQAAGALYQIRDDLALGDDLSLPASSSAADDTESHPLDRQSLVTDGIASHPVGQSPQTFGTLTDSVLGQPSGPQPAFNQGQPPSSPQPERQDFLSQLDQAMASSAPLGDDALVHVPLLLTRGEARVLLGALGTFRDVLQRATQPLD